jgi:predicted thioesterase
MIEFKPISVGENLVIQRHVTKEDTSLNYGSGKIENLFATPRLVAMMVEASSMLVDKSLPEGFISIGKHVEVDHYKPTLLGGTVSVEVKIVDATETRVTLSMEAYDEIGKIGEGTHVRFLVNQKKLEEKAKIREKDLEA